MTADQPAVLGFREFARRQNWKPGYVTELRKAGRLVLTDDGSGVRVAESLALIEETRDPARAGVAARHAAQRAVVATAAGQAADSDDSADLGDDVPASGPAGGHQLRRAKALADKAETDAKAAERDYQLSMGELLRADDVVAALRGGFATLRGALENLGNKYAPELAATGDEARIRVLLNEAIEHELTELNRQFSAIAKSETT